MTKDHLRNVFIPTVVEQLGRTDRAWDIYSRLLNGRIVFLVGEIEDQMASLICAQILYLATEDKKEEIFLYINSPGGSVTSTLAIYDVMQHVKPDIVTICFGQACSGAAILLLAGTHGKRYMTTNARAMIHQPSGGAQGQVTELEIQVREMVRSRERINLITSKHTTLEIKTIEQLMERDTFMGAEEAKQYGIIDSILGETEQL